MNTRPALSALVLALSFAQSFLPRSAAAASLDWSSCLSEAKSANLDFKQALERLEQARSRKAQAASGFLPKLDLSASLGQSGPYDALDGSFGSAVGGSPRSSLSLGASQSLFAGFAKLSNFRQASAALEASEAAARASAAQDAHALRTAFLNLAFSEASLALAKDTAARRAENVDLVRLRYDAGREHKGSWMQTKASSARADYELGRAGRAISQASRALALALGRVPDSSLRAALPSDEPPLPGEPAEGAEQSLPPVEQAAASLRQVRAAVPMAFSAFLPSVSANGSLSRSGAEWLGGNGSWNAGLSASWNLFNGLGDLLKVSEARAKLRESEQALEQTRREALNSLRNSWESLQDALENAAYVRQALEAAETQAEIARAQYAQGMLTFENWDQIETNLISVRQQALQSRQNAWNAQASWTKTLGKGFEP